MAWLRGKQPAWRALQSLGAAVGVEPATQAAYSVFRAPWRAPAAWMLQQAGLASQAAPEQAAAGKACRRGALGCGFPSNVCTIDGLQHACQPIRLARFLPPAAAAACRHRRCHLLPARCQLAPIPGGPALLAQATQTSTPREASCAAATRWPTFLWSASGISASSRTLTTASRRSPTGCWRWVQQEFWKPGTAVTAGTSHCLSEEQAFRSLTGCWRCAGNC